MKTLAKTRREPGIATAGRTMNSPSGAMPTFSGRITNVPSSPTTFRAASAWSRLDVPTNPATNELTGRS